MKKTTKNLLSNKLDKKAYNALLASTITTVSNEAIYLNETSSKQVFNENIEVFKPNKKDLTIEAHCHYNPKAIANLFMNLSTYQKYNLGELKIKVIVERLSRDGFRVWMSINTQAQLEKVFNKLVEKGYTFNAK